MVSLNFILISSGIIALFSIISSFIISVLIMDKFSNSGTCEIDISESGIRKDQTFSLSASELFIELDDYALSIKQSFLGKPIGSCYDFCEHSLSNCKNVDGTSVSPKECYKSCISCREHKELQFTQNCITQNCQLFHF